MPEKPKGTKEVVRSMKDIKGQPAKPNPPTKKKKAVTTGTPRG